MSEYSPIYDVIGQTYAQTRRADPRLVQQLLDALTLGDSPGGGHVLEVGAGTGNYTAALAARGLNVIAIEPSSVMLRQARERISSRDRERVELIQAKAEALPFRDGRFDASLGVLCLHHFHNPEVSVREMVRVTRVGGNVVFFTADPRQKEDVWIDDYFGFLSDSARDVYPPTQRLLDQLTPLADGPVVVQRVPLPRDLEDFFFLAGWARPALYLDPEVRAGISHMQKAVRSHAGRRRVDQAVSRLKADLESGIWAKRYGDWLERHEVYDGGYRIVSFRR